MEDEFDEDGMRNEGSHYVCFQANKYPTGKKEYIYFDSFGMSPPQEVIDFFEKYRGRVLLYGINSSKQEYPLQFFLQ
jgi:hypothetical protein